MKKLSFIILLLLLSIAVHSQTADITSGCAPLTVQFTPPAGLTSPLWDFGDGATSVLEMPGHTFDDPGDFIVELFDEGTKVGEIEIKVYEPTQIMIAANEQNGCSPFTVQFTDMSVVDPDLSVSEYRWNFGDGGFSTMQNPTYTYQNEGVFDVTLTIESDENGCTETMTFSEFITVSGKVAAGFSLNQFVACEAPGSFIISNNTIDGSGYIYNWDFGNGESSDQYNPGTIIYNEEGTYNIKLIVDNGDGCEIEITRTVKVGKPKININPPDTVCINVPYTLTNTSNANTYEWNFGSDASPAMSNEKNPTVLYTKGGQKSLVFSAIATEACKSDSLFSIFVEDPSAEFTIDPLFACQEPATYTFTHPNPNFAIYNYYVQELDDEFLGSALETYTYTPPTRDSFYINRSDTFNVILNITTQAGCLAKDTTYFIHRAPQAHFIPNISRGCAPLTVTFDEDSKSNEPITSWSWIFGDGDVVNTNISENMIHTYDEPGEYHVKIAIENEDGCRDTSAGIFIYVGEPLTAEYTVDNSEICMYESISMNTDNLDPRIDAYHFNTDDSRTSHCYLGTSNDHEFIHSPGTYPITLTLEYNGCYSEIDNGSTVTVRGSKSRIKYMTNCAEPLTVMLQDSSVNANTSIWIMNNDTINMDTIATNPFNYTFDTTGVYDVMLITTDGSACDPDTAVSTLHIQDIKADFDLPEFVCEGQAVAISAANSIDVDDSCSKGYTWYGVAVRPRTLDIPTVDAAFPPGENTVRLITEDINGCTDTLDKVTTALEITADFLADDNIICYPANLDFTDLSTSDTTIVSWEWSFESELQNPNSITFDQGPEDILPIELLVENDIGCTDSITVNIPVYQPVSNITIDPSTIVCLGETIGFTASDFTEQGHFLDFQWLFEGEIIEEQNPTFVINNPGINPLTLVIMEDSTECSNEYEFNLQGIELPIAELGSEKENYCVSDGSVVFENSSFLDGPGAYFWNFDNGLIISSPTTDPVSSTYESGTYEISLTVSSIYGCSDTDTYTINVNEPLGQFIIDDADNRICIDDEVTFTITDTTDVASYTFDFGEGNTVENVSPVSNVFGYYPPNGTYDVVLSLISSQGCTNSTTIPVNAFQVVADIDPDSLICLGEVLFSNPADTFGVALDYQWDFGNGETSTNSTELIEYAEPGTYSLSLTVTNDESGCEDSFMDQLIVQPNPLLDYLDSVFCVEDSAFLEFNNLNPDYIYTFDPDLLNVNMLMDGNTSEVVAIDPEINEYILTVEDQFGCISTDTININITTAPIIPNLFSPNGDEHNDFFDVVINPDKFRRFTEIETFKVYNRWGNLLYDNDSPETGWNGKLNNGDDAPAETYTYVIKIVGIPDVFKGTVTLIK